MDAAANKIDPKAASDLDALRADMAALKRDMALALAHMKSGAVNGTRTAAAHLADTANELSESLSAQGERIAKTVSDHIEQQPMSSVLIAFAAGLFLSRFLSR